MSESYLANCPAPLSGGEGGCELYRDVHGDIRFKIPDGSDLPTAGPPPRRTGNLEHLIRAHRRLGLRIGARTCVPLWEGEKMDHAMAIDVLCQSNGRL